MPRYVIPFVSLALLFGVTATASAQAPESLMPIQFEHSAEFRWLKKEVLDSRLVDAMRDPSAWTAEGTANVRFGIPGTPFGAAAAVYDSATRDTGAYDPGVYEPAIGEPAAGDAAAGDPATGNPAMRDPAALAPKTDNAETYGPATYHNETHDPRSAGPDSTSAMHVLRVDMQMFTDEPAPTRNGLSSVNLRRTVGGEDWTAFNRISTWIRPEVTGFPMLPLQIVLHNEGEEAVPDVFYREGIHYVTLQNDAWQQVVWEIEPIARDSVTALEIGYWVNKRLAEPGDRVAFEIGPIELQRVEPDHYEGWNVAPGKISFSHTGYATGASKTALASGLAADDFELIRIDDTALPKVMLRKPIRRTTSRLGEYQVIDFTEIDQPGRYVIRAGDTVTRPFRIAPDVWEGTIWKTLNFFFGERCGYAVPGSHGIDHQDWTATLGDKKIVMNGGWHDAGDLSQGLINTGEATYAMFALARQLKESGGDPALVARLIDEGTWGLRWLLKVRFDGGYRIGFASNNLWTNNIIGDADDRSREALNNPNVNYIAAAAEAVAYRVLKDVDPDLAARSLRIAEDDWRHAIVGVEGPETWSTPAYAATPIELAGIGILTSLELFDATRKPQYADKAVALARTILDSQQITFVGSEFPLAGFFFEGPDRERIFHQFHRGNDQAPIVALARLVETFPDHADWMAWYATLARYAEYQKRSARTTEPYGVLPAYIYHDTEYLTMPEGLERYNATPEVYRDQVLQGMPMGDGYHLKAFPVWFGRRGNFGVLLAQAKALSAASRVRRDAAGADLAQKQAQWIVGRNPFSQSTMYGEGYDWTQQYSVSSGDFVGSLPVGMKTRGNRDVPYWPPQNMYTYKEVWVHPPARWLWLMEDLTARSAGSKGMSVFDAEPGSGSGGFGADWTVSAETAEDGEVAIRLTVTGEGMRTFTMRTSNLDVDDSERTVTLEPGRTVNLRWTGTLENPDAPWVAVVIPDGDVDERQEVVGARPRYTRLAE